MHQVLVIEDNQHRSNRRSIAGVIEANRDEILVRIHKVCENKASVIAQEAYFCGLSASSPRLSKAIVALDLVDRTLSAFQSNLIVASSDYGCNQGFIKRVSESGIDFIVQLRLQTRVKVVDEKNSFSVHAISQLVANLKWQEFYITEPVSQQKMLYSAALIGKVLLPSSKLGTLFVAQRGGILGIHHGTTFALSSVLTANVEDLVKAVGWIRWIRPIVRQQERSQRLYQNEESKSNVQLTLGTQVGTLNFRANLVVARQQDKNADWKNKEGLKKSINLRQLLRRDSSALNVAELFAGAGGMGLGFLMANCNQTHFKLVFSGEVQPTYVETLKYNHATFKERLSPEIKDIVPQEIEPLDLRQASSLEAARRSVKAAGTLHVLIGGPPCQGFSSANRNSSYSENPYNKHIDTFLTYVEKLKPLISLMENVQGIIRMPKANETNIGVIPWVTERMSKAGYLVFPKLLDAVWYGVPQYRSRFFMLGIHRDLGYSIEDFDSWGPFPLPTHGPETAQPFVTVEDAIADLPSVENGWAEEKMPYHSPPNLRSNAFLRLMRNGAPKGVIYDHVTSRHAEYVIERYRQIPPGGNWQDIVEHLTNYADVKRTHSNIYRRLRFDEPSITMGHYRKSMIVHPSQVRGLSLREASRLQSIPDWFRFAGGVDGVACSKGGLTHKQQQLANAVCPLVTKILAEFISNL
jgi:DNA-cytosine methyltransferase